MENLAVVGMILIGFFSFCLIAFAVFIIGFFIGFKAEGKRILKKTHQNENDTDKLHKNSKNEWKNFLEYDGSVPYKYE